MDRRNGTAGVHAILIQRVLILIALVAVTALLWRLRDMLLLIFGAVLVAVIFRALADPLHRRVGLPQGLALGATALATPTTVPGEEAF